MKQLVALLIGCNILTSCATVPRPDTDLCVVNAEGPYQMCFNMKSDYKSDGKLKPDAKPKYKPALTVMDLNKNICTDPDGFANLRAYITKLRKVLNK